MGVSSAPPTGGGLEPPVPLTDLATQAAHTALANVTGSTAVPTAATMAALLADLKAQNTTVVTLGANADSIGITGLDGQTDGNYKITLDLTVVLTNTRLFTFQPNSLATNQEYVGLNSAAATITYDAATTDLRVVNAVSSTTRITGTIYFQSKSGSYRLYEADIMTDRPQYNSFTGWWKATGTALTGFRVLGTETNGIQAGSKMIVEKLRETS